ncbi:hypothetical protein QE152_g20801 [Popillia japonica]|uniref:Uncharacterized protein n=1 Tax=Popillia japonica TaxID=7064 RepID=A0AAW1KND1_POPJA
MESITDASSKTKTEIKNNVKKLKRQLTDIHKEWKVLDEGKGSNKQIKTEVKETQSVSIQVKLEDIKKDFDEKKVLVANKIRMVIEENSTLNRLAEILEEKWPQESYKITETEAADNTAKIDHYGDYAILMDLMENKLVDSLTLKYAGLAQLIEKTRGTSGFSYIDIKHQDQSKHARRKK